MNPLTFVTRPVRDLLEALVMPFRALFVIGITFAVNAMTYSGVWWFKWVAFGMGIAVLVSLGRALKAALVLGLVAWVGWKLYQRYGEAARRRFDDWVNQERRAPAEIVGALRSQA
jgi:hypothetical protein